MRRLILVYGGITVQEGLSDKFFDIFGFQWFIFSLFVEFTELGIGNDGGRIEFDFIRFEKWSAYKSLNVFRSFA